VDVLIHDISKKGIRLQKALCGICVQTKLQVFFGLGKWCKVAVKSSLFISILENNKPVVD
jgi:hypothetical protein